MVCRRTFLLVIDLVSVLFFSGVIFGWTSLQQILLSEGFYKALCVDGEPLPCDAQKTALNKAFTIASTAVSLVAFPAGALLDRYGPLLSITIAGVVEIGGLVGIAVCEQVGSVEVDVFLWSLVAIAIGGSMTMFCGYSLAFLFPEQSSLVLGLTSCLFDGSCIIFPLVKVAYDAHISFDELFWGYVVLAGIIYGLLILAWGLNNADMTRVRTASVVEVDPQNNSQASETLAEQPIKRQVRSPEFVAMFIFASIQLTRSNLYLGSVDLVDEQIARETGATESSATVGTIIGLVIPFGFMAVPLFTASLSRFGVIGTLQVTNLLGLLFNSLQFVPNLYCQLASVTMFTLWRAFLFSIVCDFNASTFGILSMGTIQGFCFLGGAFVNLAQVPLVAWSVGALSGDFRPLLGISLAAAAPLPLLWIWVRWKQSARSPLEQRRWVPQDAPRRQPSVLSNHGCACTSTQTTLESQGMLTRNSALLQGY